MAKVKKPTKRTKAADEVPITPAPDQVALTELLSPRPGKRDEDQAAANTGGTYRVALKLYEVTDAKGGLKGERFQRIKARLEVDPDFAEVILSAYPEDALDKYGIGISLNEQERRVISGLNKLVEENYRKFGSYQSPSEDGLSRDYILKASVFQITKAAYNNPLPGGTEMKLVESVLSGLRAKPRNIVLLQGKKLSETFETFDTAPLVTFSSKGSRTGGGKFRTEQTYSLHPIFTRDIETLYAELPWDDNEQLEADYRKITGKPRGRVPDALGRLYWKLVGALPGTSKGGVYEEGEESLFGKIFKSDQDKTNRPGRTAKDFGTFVEVLKLRGVVLKHDKRSARRGGQRIHVFTLNKAYGGRRRGPLEDQANGAQQ